LTAWSVTQGVRALSSGEAEFYVLVNSGSQLLGMRALLEDLGMKVRIHF